LFRRDAAPTVSPRRLRRPDRRASLAASVRTLRERPAARPPSLSLVEWGERFPWLVAGTTTRGVEPEPFDLGLFSGGSPGEGVRSRWEELRAATGMTRIVHAPQVHGAEVRAHGEAETRSVPLLVSPCDGHATDRPGLLLAVTTADCVPVFLVDARRRAVSVVHAGWRGAAAGIVERALDLLSERWASEPADVHVHFGPAICGSCYEVGPEVFAALGRGEPERPTPIDLRAILAERVVERGVPGGQVSISAHCTRCTESALFSHRGGDRARQVGFLGIRPGGQEGR